MNAPMDSAGLELARRLFLAGTASEGLAYFRARPVRETSVTIAVAVVEPMVWYASTGPLQPRPEKTSLYDQFRSWTRGGKQHDFFQLDHDLAKPDEPGAIELLRGAKDKVGADQTDLLRSVLLKVFPSAQFSSESKTDPDEGWTRRVLTVQTGLEDIRARIAFENTFYELVAQDAKLAEALRAVTVLFD